MSEMKDQKARQGVGLSKGTGASGDFDRLRLAEALRANLLRRKDQKRERDRAADASADTPNQSLES